MEEDTVTADCVICRVCVYVPTSKELQLLKQVLILPLEKINSDLEPAAKPSQHLKQRGDYAKRCSTHPKPTTVGRNPASHHSAAAADFRPWFLEVLQSRNCKSLLCLTRMSKLDFVLNLQERY